MPTFSIAYGIHRFYRRYRPRRLPTLTSLKLPEVYISLAVASSALVYGALSEVAAEETDRDLLSLHRLLQDVPRRAPATPGSRIRKLGDAFERDGILRMTEHYRNGKNPRCEICHASYSEQA